MPLLLLKLLVLSNKQPMAWYRIKIWTKQQQKPFEGIRWVDNTFIDNVYRMYENNAKGKYGYDFLDIEVQQLSKLCRAIIAHCDKLEKQKRAEKK